MRIRLTAIQLAILGIVDQSPGISQSNISKNLGRNRMIVNYHIKILRDANMLSLEKVGRESMCYTTEIAKLSIAKVS
jgi:predicted transcriptional regulator